MDNSKENMLSFCCSFRIGILILQELGRAHINHCDIIFCIDEFHTIEIFHIHVYKEESDQYMLFFVFQSKILLYYDHMGNISIYMDL